MKERSLNTMSEAIALSSPSGRMSKRSLKAAQERIREELFGKEGLKQVFPLQSTEVESLLRQARELRELAARGMKPRAYIRKAEELESKAKELMKFEEND